MLLSDLLKDRRYVSAEEEERINAAVEKEIEEYRKAGLLEDLDKEK